MLVYFNSLFNGFVWDDEEQIVNNSVIQNIKNIPIIFSGGAFNSGGTGELLGIYYKPLMTLSFTLIYSVFGLKPFFYHLLSIIIYIANGVLANLFLSRFFKKESLKVLLLSILFLVHPLYSEVILYMANIQDLLYFFFGMIGLLLLNYYSGIFFLLALLSKETGIVFILISILYSYFYKKENLATVLLSSIASIALYSFLRFGLAEIYFPTHDMAPIAGLSLVERLTNMPTIFVYYLKNFLLPINIAINQHWVVGKLVFLDLLIMLVFVSSLFFLAFKKGKNALFFSIVFILGILPHMQIFPLDVTVSGRWFYAASLGLTGLLGIIINKKWGVYMLMVPIIIFSFISFDRTYDFRNGFALYSNDIKHDKDNFNLLNNLGVEYYRLGRYDKAGEYFTKSVNSNPKWWTNYNNLGVYYEGIGELEEAKKMYKKAIQNGNYYLAYENYAKILIKQKKNDEAKVFLRDSLQVFPQNKVLISLLSLLEEIE